MVFIKKEPLYNTTVEIQPIPATDWSKAMAYLVSKASFVSQLLLGEMPENIESVFVYLKLHLLPDSRKDFDRN